NLNDTKEVGHAVELFLEAVQRRRQLTMTADVDYLFNIIEEGLASARVETLGTFVACFSELDDDLSQWRAYGGNQGYCIELDSDRLYHGLSVNMGTCYLTQVCYDENTKKRIADESVKGTEAFYQNGLDQGHPREEFVREFLRTWFQRLSL